MPFYATMTNTEQYKEFVANALRAKSASGSRMAHKGNSTFVYLATCWKNKFGLPLKSRLSNEDADGIKEALALTVAEVAERLCSYDKVTIKEDTLYARVDKKTGSVVAGVRGSISAHRACHDDNEKRLAVRLAKGNVLRSMEALNKKVNWSEKDEARYGALQVKLNQFANELEALRPMTSDACYDDETEVRQAMASA